MTATPITDGPKRVIPAHRLAPRAAPNAFREEGRRRVSPAGAVITEGPVTGGFREASRSNHRVRNAGCVQRVRGDYACVLSTFCTRGCGCVGHPAFRAPSIRGERIAKDSGAPAPQTTGVIAHDPDRNGRAAKSVKRFSDEVMRNNRGAWLFENRIRNEGVLLRHPQNVITGLDPVIHQF